MKFQTIFDLYKNNLYFRALFVSLLVVLFLRIFSSLILLIGIIQPQPDFPYAEITQNNIQYLEQRSEFSKLFLAPWYRWDTGHYIEIAEFGYDFDPVNSVWPPLYPFLIKLLGFIVKPTILSAILVSNIFFVFGLFLLYLLIHDIFNEEIAKRTLFFAVIFPTSFYFVAGYTESIYLFLSLSVFLFIKKKKWAWAGIISALAALTRVQGLLLIVPIIIELWFEFIKNRDYKTFFTHIFTCLYAPFSYGLYSLYVYFGLKTDWPWITLSKQWDQNFGWPWEGVISMIRILFGYQIDNDITPTIVKILNIILPALAIYFLYKIQKKIPLSISIYSWAMFLLILVKIDENNAINSTIRYLLAIFPIFTGMAIQFRNKFLNLAYFSMSIVLQAILIFLFYMWMWIA
jgi:Gpi18-like mannosyltransferase